MADAMTTAEHEELRAQIGAFVLGALSAAESAEVRAHIATCAECGAEARELQAASDAIAWSVEPVAPPHAVRDRVLGTIANDTAPAALASTSPRRALASRAPWLAVAAAVLVAVGLGAYGLLLRARVQTLEQQLGDAVTQIQAGNQRAAAARVAAADAARQLSVLAAPDVAHVDLKGQSAAPHASARVLWSRSRGLLFSATDLPPLPPGRTYQLWVISGKSAPISDGWIFKTDASGTVTTLFETPTSIPPPTAIAVTVEPDGGLPAPSGAMQLVGTLVN